MVRSEQRDAAEGKAVRLGNGWGRTALNGWGRTALVASSLEIWPLPSGWCEERCGGQFCDYCNAADPGKAHPITNAIDGTERWWQSPPLSMGLKYNEVNVTLDLGQENQIVGLSKDFNCSDDNSKADCLERFGKEANLPVRRDSDVLCTTEYSRILPLENGEIVVSLVNGRPGAKNFTYSPSLREFTKATNIRLHFLRTNTLLGHLISKAQRDPTVTRRRMMVRILFWWSACNCHGHATDCYYDADVDQRRESLNILGHYEGGGVCINCQHNTAGINCEKCAKGYYRPYGVSVRAPDGCILCECNLAGTQPEVCDFLGRCLCRSGVAGLQCDSCQPGHHSFPACQECNCDAIGSVEKTCGPRGQCLCHSNYAGLSCDQCAPGYYSYPSCLPCQCSPDGSQHDMCESVSGQCWCRTGVTGRQCDRCLSAANSFPYCQGANSECDPSGSIGSHSDNGHCYCKSNVCGDSCDTCEAGYYALENKNYFGCQGCQCDIGGSLSPMCAEPQGGCQCRPHVVGTACHEPEKNYFFPDLHHMKFEIEEGASVKGREIRFGYDPQEFPGFSWRGYARMSSIQNEVRITLNVEKSNLYLFRIILRYINPGGETLSGHISACQSRPETGAAQSKEIVFPPSKEPAFVTIPGKSSTEPFSLVPGTWTVSIMAEEVLLVDLQMTINVPQVGRYVLVFEYANEEDQLYTAEVIMHSPGPVTEGRVRIYSCKYSFLCRSVVVDDRNRIAAYDLLADTKIHLKASSINFLLHKVCIISAKEFSSEYVDPKVQCIAAYKSTHDGRLSGVTGVQARATLRVLWPEILTAPSGVSFCMLLLQLFQNGFNLLLGSFNASFCPHTSGCRDQVIAENRIELDISEPEVSVTVMIPDGRTLVLFVDMRNWRLEAVDENIDIPVTFNPVSNSVVADVQELPASVHSLYWKAPPSYLGEKLSSYGGFLSYQVKSFGLPSEGMVLLDKRPDIQLTGQQMKVVYMDPNNPLPDRQYYGRVQLVEGNFRHASSNNLVSREELMIILSRLDGLHIRGLYFTETQRLTLGEVGLEEATSMGSGSVAYSVERCSCPPENVPLDFIVRIKDYSLDAVSPAAAMEIQIGVKMVLENVLTVSIILLGTNVSAVKMVILEMPLKVPVECVLALIQTDLQLAVWQMVKKFSVSAKKAILEFVVNECFNNEPKDVDPNEDCDPCDSCVITLLKDLRTIGDELLLIKSQLQNVHESTHTLEQMRHLETRIKDLKVLLNNYRSVVHNQGSKADELETEFIKLNRDINALQEKAEINYKAAEMLFNNFGQTHQKGKDLVSRIQIVVNNIQVLLEQIAGTNAESNNLPLGDAAKELAEAERMVREMRNRNFGQLQAEAEKERTEAQLLLARIKNELQRYHQENHGLIKIVRDSLNEYESKITDLREALNEATGQIKQAENLNRDNGVLLEDIKKRIEETNVQQKSILDILSSARTSLTQANSVLGLLRKSKEEYESLAAQLDGARKDMNEKLANSSLSASKEPLVLRAEEHAKSLQDLAKQLEEIKNSARKDELVGCAVEASTAYDNIINAIKAAEEAASKAGNAADSALLGIHCFAALGPTLEDIKQRIDVADGKKNALQIDLVTLQNNLNGINRDDIDGIITSAKNMVKSAEDVTTNVLDELLPIQEDVEKMKSTYGSTQSAGFSKALMEANNSVKKLTNKLPDLFSKIESINQQLMPISNISENLNRIRELIQQARDAANKVAIPMRFNGSSGVEVRPPSNLEDLKGYTSLSFFLQRPLLQTRLDTLQRTSDKFVLYLGNKDASKDYIGMAVKDGHLTCVYNLGDGDVEIDVQPLVTQSETEEAVMDQVKFERIYQYAKLNYIKEATSTSPEYKRPLTASSGSNDILLNLDPSTVVFYVGGYPPDFRPPRKLDYPHYEGCIELDNLNERIISLYNFKRTFNLNTTEVQPCRRYKEETDQSYFEGTGYASVTLKEPNIHSRVRYEQTIETTADEGIVFFAANEDQFISVLIKDGHTVFRYKVGSDPPKEIETNATVNDGTFKQIHLVLARSRNTVHVSPDIKANINVFPFTKYYLGGIPSSLRERFDISTPPFRGCMKNVKNPNTASVIFDETVGVSKKCSDDWKLIRSAAFSKKGTLSLNAAGFPFPKDFQVGFGFQTTASTGTLLNYNLWPNILTIFLRPGIVTAKMGEMEIELKKNYEDGSLHYVTVIKTDNRTGQLPEVQNLINYTAKTGVSLGACHKYENLKPMLLKEFKNPLMFKMLKVKNENYLDYLKAANLPNQQNHNLPTQLNVSSEAYLLGNTPNSFLSYMFSPPASTDRLHFSADVRTRSSRGLIVFMEERSEDSYMALHISKGCFVFSLGSGGRQIKIKTSTKYNDGQWHTVVFGTDGKNVRLVVDGLRAQHGRLATNSAISIKSPVYVGGLPSLKRQNIPMNSFKGCLRNFKMNGQVLNAPQQKNGVLPCLDAPAERGIYFFNEGGYITIGNLLLGLDFRIVFTIRPRSSTGILLHAGSDQDNYLTIYMKRGKVIAAGNSGAGEFQTSVTPKRPLSNGQWHTIAVSQKENMLQLEVGPQHNYTTGLPSLPPRRIHQPLYFGKIPANLDTAWLPVKDPFFGCLRNININDKHVSTRRISEVHGVPLLTVIDIDKTPLAAGVEKMAHGFYSRAKFQLDLQRKNTSEKQFLTHGPVCEDDDLQDFSLSEAQTGQKLGKLIKGKSN
ncbi:Lama3 [Columba guinea]|nr:Lama3 [Columba guinea]